MNILLIYGGKSCEHDISIITACLSKGLFKGNLYSAYLDKQNACYLVPNTLTPAEHLTYKFKKRITFLLGESKIGVTTRRGTIIKKIPIDVVVNCCHGINGEDGAISALCQMSNVACVGSGMIASGVAMDKWLTKCVLKNSGIPTLKGFVATLGQGAEVAEKCSKLGFPVIVKPTLLGSSIGVSIANNTEQLLAALKNAHKYSKQVLVEKALENFEEYNCSALKKKDVVLTSNVESPVLTQDILTFNDKYLSGQPFEKRKKQICERMQDKIKKMTEKVYNALQLEGVVRVDYLLDKTTNKLYVNEVNAIPGSLSYGMWENEFSRTEFGQALVEQAVKDYRQKQTFCTTFLSSVLTESKGKK